MNRLAAAALCAVFLAACSNNTKEVRFSDADVGESPFIFAGTVVTAGSSNVDLVPSGADTAIVRVDEVLSSSPALADYAGAEITVKLAPRDVARQGSRSTFLTTPLAYGTSVAVKVNRRVPINNVAAIRTDLASAAQRNADNALAARLSRAEVVVVGRVDVVRPVERSPRITEHDPMLAPTVIAIEAVLKGPLAGTPSITALQSRSIDVMWYRAPKLEPGQRGVFLLHRGDELTAGRSEALIIVDPLDVLPAEQAERVRALVARNR